MLDSTADFSLAAKGTVRPEFVELHREDHAAVRAELIAGLLSPAAFTSPKYLYDALGSRLFEAITELPEYYPTRTEAAIFRAHAADMAALQPAAATLVDLGAGNCAKAAGLFEAFAPARYVAVDISVAFLRQALGSLQAQHPKLPMVGVGMDFSSAFSLPAQAGAGPHVLFYPGSSIGNFTPETALRFLQQLRSACEGGGLLIGVDLCKPRALLEPAYDDALGVTAAFNRNLLMHLNAFDTMAVSTIRLQPPLPTFVADKRRHVLGAIPFDGAQHALAVAPATPSLGGGHRPT
jgi:dimethylhistidine N-methyltransferase